MRVTVRAPFLCGVCYSTTLGRDLAGSVATTLQTGLTADCTGLDLMSSFGAGQSEINPAAGLAPAQANFARALAIDPDQRSALLRRAQIALSVGDYPAALDDAERLWQAGNRDDTTRLTYGDALVADGQVDPAAEAVDGLEWAEPRLRGQWLAPFILSPHNPSIVYHGMQFLFRSLDRGDTWERISPDLSAGVPAELGDIPYQTLFAISESPLRAGLIYAGTDDGRVWITRDGGKAWTEIVAGLPFQKWVSRLVASQ